MALYVRSMVSEDRLIASHTRIVGKSARRRSHGFDNLNRSQADCRHSHQQINYSIFIIGKAIHVESLANGRVFRGPFFVLV